MTLLLPRCFRTSVQSSHFKSRFYKGISKQQFGKGNRYATSTCSNREVYNFAPVFGVFSFSTLFSNSHGILNCSLFYFPHLYREMCMHSASFSQLFSPFNSVLPLTLPIHTSALIIHTHKAILTCLHIRQYLDFLYVICRSRSLH